MTFIKQEKKSKSIRDKFEEYDRKMAERKKTNPEQSEPRWPDYFPSEWQKRN